jgi:AAA domain
MTAVFSTDAALAFLERWRPGGPWVLTSIVPDGVTETRTFHAPAQARAWIDRRQGNKNIYFSVNTPKTDLKKKAAKTDIAELNALHVDLDAALGLAPEEAKPALLERANSYRVPPSIIIDSGGGIQVYWRLREPIALNGAGSVALLEAYNRQLETDLGADSCHNIDRIMRLPGTVNLPNAVKLAKGRGQYPTAVISADWERQYTLEDFSAAKPRGSSHQNGQSNGSAGNGSAGAGRPEENIEKVIKWLPTWLLKKLQATSVVDRSKALFSIISALIELNFDDMTIERIIRAHPGGPGSKYAGRTDLAAEIDRIRAKILEAEDEGKEEEEDFEEGAAAGGSTNGHAGDEQPLAVVEVHNAGDIDAAKIPPRGWLLGTTFCRKFISGLIGSGTAGKTTVRYVQYLAAATGRKLTDEHVHVRCRILIACLEDDLDEIRRRIAAALLHYRIDSSVIDGWIYYCCPRGLKLRLMPLRPVTQSVVAVGAVLL